MDRYEIAYDKLEEAKNHLYQALGQLNTARAWGVFDILRGGLISTLIKHSHSDTAEEHIECARRRISEVQRLLPEKYMVNIDSAHDGFARFADWAFDSLLSDLFMQSKIKERREMVERLLRRIEQFQESLVRGNLV